MRFCRRGTGRSRDRDWDRSRDRSWDRGYPRDKHGDRGRASGRRPDRDHIALDHDAKGSQSERARGQRGSARDHDRDRDRNRDSRGDNGLQHRDGRNREEYPVNSCGVLVSPENIQRAKQGRQVKSLNAGWLAAQDSGKSKAAANCSVNSMWQLPYFPETKEGLPLGNARDTYTGNSHTATLRTAGY